MQASIAPIETVERKSAEALPAKCYHCGSPCPEGFSVFREKSFCCNGCQTVFELLTDNGLANFYELNDAAGVRVKPQESIAQFAYLDEPSVRQRLVDFTDDEVTRITFRIPAIHCIACVWLLENLFKLRPGIGYTKVNFPRKEAAITFENKLIKLSEVAALLGSLGYEPDLKLADLETPGSSFSSRRLSLQLGIAGFAFGNIMLLSISAYLGLDEVYGPSLKSLFAIISFLLVLPVFFYSAADYWKSAWVSFKQKRLTIEVPIAAGIAAVFGQSIYEVLSKTGDGYFDSLAGLLFFLLCGKMFQQKTFERLNFERDYKSFFPLSVTRRNENGSEEKISLDLLRAGDQLAIRSGELIPADARLLSDSAVIDYSFVTGESRPVEKLKGDYLYSGGRQIGPLILLQVLKPVSQSYLTSLWNQEAFQKKTINSLDTLINRYSERFSRIVITIALGSALFWAFNNPSLALKSFVAVLIVACPCALALAVPFSLGTAIRVFGRNKVFIKGSQTIETLATVNSVVFDKTGTLTGITDEIKFEGIPLSEKEQNLVAALSGQSTHPMSVRISLVLPAGKKPVIRSFKETPGIGIEGIVDGHTISVGSHVVVGTPILPVLGSSVNVTIDGIWRGRFVLEHSLRPEAAQAIKEIASSCEVALLSGDNEADKDRFTRIFSGPDNLYFNQSPINKLEYIERLQKEGKIVMMVADGLNDAGALKQSNAGVAVVENISAFCPASDVIMSAEMVGKLPALLAFSRAALRVARISFVISAAYNIVGISFAAQGLLSPIICAILMPLSSITVVGFSCLAVAWSGKKFFPEARAEYLEFPNLQPIIS